MASQAPHFDEVYEACHRHVFALCRHLLDSSDDAQDAFQETFLQVAQALPQFRGESNIKTWVHRIAVRTALKLRARRPIMDELDTERSEDAGDLASNYMETDSIARAMANLSFEHRLVLSLFAVEGFTHREIASTLGIPEGTVWSRLHHAKKQFALLSVQTGG